ncbi:myo-inositol-1(or 4)-monophosphatase [Buchnera aphidicola str. Bp (Baizongia pistaciae)]|uniref:Nus factor SuhB n=1 Tax=Buchnera aphidicola subsp. Baizongia pistaciae (strain Bp) TaxID=224915 RepID=SUHB_BUCBP|nr:inositol monophosphatase family protein [Buchnera aphidicola]Q89AK9.1 RecName: Full=Nus factor SuhB; AltName: Full=Inositol-1-monophosphatase; Short=I-1-Pase; Short=IMPase; Short=Inositol-1-phosphatase [Buchnera aphidicola str. Bp (Baizongia pistaciae)]AAO26990.1 myo-inositol-1(or 4)-monophosphatase [Buchnera aphidicola str. Bp (Baizongia pistaciae)]
MHPILNIAIRVARKCGNILIQYYDRNKTNNEKQILKKDFITKIIFVLEKTMIDMIHKSYPEHSIITYHKNNKIFKNTEIIWLINALDGIKNFENNLPHFCISIAIIVRKTTQISVIYDPIRNELFTSVKGQGSQLNGYRMRCKSTNTLKRSLVGLVYPCNNSKFQNYFFTIINLLFSHEVKLRCTGCISLDCAYVAMGRLDYLFNGNLIPLLFSSGSLQIKESGGLISDLNGGHDYVSSGIILIGNPKLMRVILVKIRELFQNNLK